MHISQGKSLREIYINYTTKGNKRKEIKTMNALFAAFGICAFIFVLCGGYAAWMCASYLVYKIRDNGNMTLREFSQDW